jgi:hypothetical protein
LLCVGPISEAEAPHHPLVGFKAHAVRTNEIFLLVADLVAQGLAQLLPLAATSTHLPPHWMDVWAVSESDMIALVMISQALVDPAPPGWVGVWNTYVCIRLS